MSELKGSDVSKASQLDDSNLKPATTEQWLEGREASLEVSAEGGVCVDNGMYTEEQQLPWYPLPGKVVRRRRLCLPAAVITGRREESDCFRKETEDRKD